MRTTASLAILALALLTGTARGESTLSLWVQAAGGTSFGNKGLQDSARDLLQELQKRGATVAATAPEADIVVEVVERHEEPVVRRGRRDEFPVLKTQLKAGSYTFDIVERYTEQDAENLRLRRWRTVAGKVAQDVQNWIIEFGDRLSDIKTGAFTPAAKGAVASPSPSAPPATADGWYKEEHVNEMTGLQTVVLSRGADERIFLTDPAPVHATWNEPYVIPTLVLRCKDQTFEIMVDFRAPGQELWRTLTRREMKLRFDSEPAEEFGTTPSTDLVTAFFSEADVRSLTRKLLTHERLLLEFTPVGQTPKHSHFQIAGLDAEMGSLQAACPALLTSEVASAPMPGIDSWYSAPPENVSWCTPSSAVRAVAPSQQAAAQPRLEKEPVVEVTRDEASRLTGKPYLPRASHWFLARAVRLQGGEGTYEIESCADGVVEVHHNAQGTLPMKREAVVIESRERPKRLYATCADPK